MSSLRFRLLGPVTLEVAGGPVELGPVELGPLKRRTVLAALLVNAGRPVSLPTLAEWVWPEPPMAARSVRHAHISRLRQVVLSAAERVGTPVDLVRVPGGYRLDVADDLVDARVFERRLRQVLGLGEREGGRVDLLRRALDPWHGEVPADIPGGRAAGVRLVWQQQMLSATTAWARRETLGGRPDRVIARLTALPADYPHAESLGIELMRAMSVTGRRSQALELYAVRRRRLVDDLGVEPGSEPRNLHLDVLRGVA